MRTPSDDPRRTALPSLRPRAWPLLLSTLLLAGCELAEVTAAAGEDVLVVEAVLRAGDDRQQVLLHRSLSGGAIRGEPDARVVVRTPEGSDVRLHEQPLGLCASGLAPEMVDSLRIEASCYASDAGALDVRPGEVYELHVEPAGGGEARGRTVVPGDFALLRPGHTDVSGSCSLPPATPLETVWSSSEDAWSYLVGVEISGLRAAFAGTGIEAPDLLELTGVAISERDTTLVFPGEIGLFDRFDENQALLIALQAGLPAGVRAEMVVTAADRNLVNAVRGGSFNPSGPVRVSSVIGAGIGLFGSLVPRRIVIEVGAQGLPSCLG